MAAYKGIDISEIDDYIGEINLIDIREHHEFKIATIKGAKNIPGEELLKHADKYLNKDEKYYIMCRAGSKSLKICKELWEHGFNVYDVAGGFNEYEGEFRI